MLRLFLFLQVAIIISLSGCTYPKSKIILHELTCENLSEPLGIGTTAPRLSWKINSVKNGTSQKAY